MVRLKESAKTRHQFTFFRFNSKMVRLKELGIGLGLYPIIMFQFQNGAIKSLESVSESDLAKTFQFQNGAIKRL